MTRDELKKKVNNLSCHLTYPILDDLHDIDDHDDEQRQVIESQQDRIKELKALVGTIRDRLGITPVRNVDDIEVEAHSAEILQQVTRRIEQQAQQIEQLQYELETAERALQRKGYRKECDLPACNCGAQWHHGGYADQRLREISDAIPFINGTTVLDRVKILMQQITKLREVLEGCLAQIQEDIKECGPCEHDVNICVCPLKILSAEAQQALKEHPEGGFP